MDQALGSLETMPALQPDEGYDLLSHLLKDPSYDTEQSIYIDPARPERCITFSEARMEVKKLIAGLTAAGVQKEDVVCVYAYNDIRYVLLFLAIIGAGAVFTGCNPSYTGTEIARHITQTGSKFVLADSDLLNKVSSDLTTCGISPSKTFQMSNQGQACLPDIAAYEDLLSHGEMHWHIIPSVEEAKTTTAALLSTSGTSGLPKAAIHSHQHFIAQSRLLDDNQEKSYKVSRLIVLPIFHAFALPLAHTLPLLQGTPTYIMRRFELSKFLEYIHDFEITETAIVPTIVTNILKSSIKAQKKLCSLRTVWCAGSTLNQLAHNDFFRLLRPTARLLQVWGMTEAGWITTFLWPEKDHSGSVGRLLDGFEAKLLHRDQEIEEDHRQGEVYVRSLNLMQGYLGNAEATTEAIDKDGWLRTGDIAYREHGKYYIVDRAKELIKVRGWQISPAELEAQLLLHPNIVEAAVVGTVSTDADTELPRAYVVKAKGTELTEAEVKGFMAEHLAKYKSLDGGIRFVDTIPRNATGKIMRAALRQMAAAEEASQQKLEINVERANMLGDGGKTSSDRSFFSATPATDRSPSFDHQLSSETDSSVEGPGDEEDCNTTLKPGLTLVDADAPSEGQQKADVATSDTGIVQKLSSLLTDSTEVIDDTQATQVAIEGQDEGKQHA